MICFLTRCEALYYRSNSFRIHAIGLKLGGMTHSNMKQIATYNGHARPIVARSTAIFRMLGPDPRDDVTALTL